MRRRLALVALPLAALAGCDKEADFNESYAAREAELLENASAMQNDLSARIAASRDAARVMEQAKADNALLENALPAGRAQ